MYHSLLYQTTYTAYFYFVHTQIICQTFQVPLTSNSEFRISPPFLFTLSSYIISPHFIYHPLPTLSSHQHTVVTNIHTCLSYLTTLIALFSFSLPISFNFHHISSSSNHFILPLRTVSSSLFTSFINHLPYYSSFSIISCPHLIASLFYFFLCFVIPMGEQYSF